MVLACDFLTLACPPGGGVIDHVGAAPAGDSQHSGRRVGRVPDGDGALTRSSAVN